MPAVRLADLEHGLLILDDLGDNTFAAALEGGAGMLELYGAAVDVLAELASHPPPENLPVDSSRLHRLPAYDRPALDIELSLLTDWYWPFLGRGRFPDAERDRFKEIWRPLIDLVTASPAGWVLRDFHSPNLLWLPERQGIGRVGVIDFQDALRGPLAYDVVSLLQDARLDVPADIEAELLRRYVGARKGSERAFDAERFLTLYAILGAQRATKILGIFARLSARDGKKTYLQHMPRVWAYLERNLGHPALGDLEAFMARNFPVEQRRRLP